MSLRIMVADPANPSSKLDVSDELIRLRAAYREYRSQRKNVQNNVSFDLLIYFHFCDVFNITNLYRKQVFLQ